MDHSNYDLSFFQSYQLHGWLLSVSQDNGCAFMSPPRGSACCGCVARSSSGSPFGIFHIWTTRVVVSRMLYSSFFCLLVISALALFSSRIANTSYTSCHQELRSPTTSSNKSNTHHCNGENAVLSCHHLSVQYVLGDAAVFNKAGVANSAWYICLPESRLCWTGHLERMPITRQRKRRKSDLKEDPDWDG